MVFLCWVIKISFLMLLFKQIGVCRGLCIDTTYYPPSLREVAKSKILTEGVLQLHILLPQSRYRSTAPSKRERIVNLRRRPYTLRFAFCLQLDKLKFVKENGGSNAPALKFFNYFLNSFVIAF